MTNQIFQWHPGFHAALQIELQEVDNLEYYSEYELNKKPLRIDTLIVKKLDEEPIQKNIGKIFRKHNLIEYKSPEDSLNINDFYRVYGYACIYQSNTERVREIRMSDITITFICSHYPREMIKILKEERGITAVPKERGIYWLENDPIPIQLIITSHLSRTDNPWLGSLRNDLQMDENMDHLLKDYNEHKESIIYQEAIDLIVRANWDVMKEEDFMLCSALQELFADELKKELEKELEKEKVKVREAARAEGIAEGLSEGRAEGMAQGLAQGLAQGMEKEGKRMTSLIQKLLSENHLNDLKKVSEDRAFCEQMYQKYGL